MPTAECPHRPNPSTFEMCNDCMNSWYQQVDNLEYRLAEMQKRGEYLYRQLGLYCAVLFAPDERNK